MPVRNLWSLEPGECIVAEEVMKKLRGVEVYFPMHDVGIDLLLVKGRKHVGIQVKESRYYTGYVWKKSGHEGHSWHQIKKKILEKTGNVDFYVFLTYLPSIGSHKISRFENRFLVVPVEELRRRAKIKDPGKPGVYSFCFHFENNRVWDERITAEIGDERANYSQFLDAWHLIKRALK
jgi:hypothetical protein